MNQTQKDQICFYHVATDVNDFQPFFRKGARAIVPKTKHKGLYVWASQETADTHIQLLDGGFLNKNLPNHEALILTFQMNRKDLTYPQWQMDVEYAPGLLELLNQHADTINKKLKNVDVNLPPNNSFLKKISGISCKKQEDKTTFQFHGKTSVNTDLNFSLTCAKNGNPCQGESDAIYLQTLVDLLCQSDTDFNEDYHQLMQKMVPNHASFRYLGEKPLPIFSAVHVSVDKKNNLKKTVLLDGTKPEQQICPFLVLKNIQR